MILRLFFAWLLPFAATFPSICLAFPPSVPWRAHLGFKLSLTTGMALGISSLVFFFWRSLAGQAGTPYLWADAVLWLVVATVFWWALWRRERGRSTPWPRPAGGAAGISLRLAGLGFAAVVLLATAGYVFRALNHPHGMMDTFVFWNLRAKFLTMSGVEWKAMSAVSFPHYPLLVSASVARLWVYTGDFTPAAPALVAAVLTAGTVGVLVTTVRLLRDLCNGWVAGMLLLANLIFLKLGALQIGDVPSGFFVLAALALVALHEGTEAFVPSPGLLALAGAAAGCVAWTKNEGWFFPLLFLLAYGACRRRLSPGRTGAPLAGWFLAGLVPFAVALGWLFFEVGPAHYAISAGQQLETQGAWAKLSDPSRHGLILWYLVRSVWLLGGWTLVVIPVAFLVAGERTPPGRLRGVADLGAVLLGLTLVGLYLFHLFTIEQSALQFFLHTSMHRRLQQLWPAAILVVFLFGRLRCPNPTR